MQYINSQDYALATDVGSAETGSSCPARNGRTGAVKATNLQRLREAATLYHILTSGT